MSKKFKITLIAVLVLIFVSPTIALAGSVTISILHGHSVQEALEILADQIDALSGRVNVLEGRMSKAELCQKANRLYILLPPQQKDATTGEWIGRIMAQNIVDLYRDTSDCTKTNKCGDARDLPIVKEYYDKYISAQAECDGK
jgi:hypothetical protein